MSQTIRDIKQQQPASINIHFISEDDMLLWFNRLIHINTRLLYWTDEFDTHYGTDNLMNKHKWQNKLRQHLAQKNIPLVNDLSKLKIIISNEPGTT